MTLSAQNTILPALGADLRPGQPEPRRDRLAPKMTMDANGNWQARDMRIIARGHGQLEVPLTGPLLAQAALRRRPLSQRDGWTE